MGFLAALVPFLTAAAPVASAAASLGSLGLGIANAASGPSGIPTPPGPTPATPPTPQQLAQQRALVQQQLPNVLGATSGLANPAYDSLIAQILAGTIGQPGSTAAGNNAVGQNFSPANSQATNAAVQGQPVQLSDFVNTST